MTKQEILTKAIQKAIDNGWKGWGWPTSLDLLKWRWEDDDRVFSDGEYDDYETMNVEAVIFSHDFAKALWGEDPLVSERNRVLIKESGVSREIVAGYGTSAWQHHLQQMVISEDPIKYLEENI